MLALLKTGRAAAAAGPAARAASTRRPPPLPLLAAVRQRAFCSGPAQRLLALHRRLVSVLRQQSRALLRLSVIQCEFVLIYRTRRSMQLFELYSSLYEREALHEMLRSVRHLLAAHGRRLLLSAALICGHEATAPPSSKPDQEDAGPETPVPPPAASHGYEEEFERFAKLRNESIVCPDCGNRQIIDRKLSHVTYCTCAGGQPTAAVNRGAESTWVPFLERNHVVVWRQQHPEQPHLYSYKVYGSYDDVSAETFFEVQLNTAYRSHWDPSVLELRVVDSGPAAGQDVIYWSVRFPSMFQNRDYVFDRRYYVDKAARQMTIVSRCTAHPDCPERAGVVRVHDYWSVMVIRPHAEFDQPGMDFGLTYFDDPGTYLPPVITNYVAATGLPNFLERVADAARTVERQLAVGKVSVPLQFLQVSRRPSETAAGARTAPGRPELSSYHLNGDFVPS